MSEQPVTKRQYFELMYFADELALNIRDFLLQIAAFWRANGADSFSDFHNDTDYGDTPLPMWVLPKLDHWNYRSNGWREHWDVTTLLVPLPNIYSWSEVLNESTLSQMYLRSEDEVFFPALSLVLSDLIKNWLEQPARLGTVAFTRKDSGHWGLRVHLDADNGAREGWKDAIDIDTSTAWLAGVEGHWTGLSYSSMRYEASFIDSQGKPASVAFHCASNSDAMAVANDLAAQSDAQWTDLFRVTLLAVPSQDAQGNPVYTNFKSAAADTSDVQRKGRCLWGTAVAGDVLKVEVPSVAASLVSRTSKESSSDPLAGGLRGYLVSENGSPALRFDGARFDTRDRRR